MTDRQIELIKAAGKLLTLQGVSGLTIKNLAKEMNFSESAVYRHFKSKDVIIIEMLNYLSKEMDARYSKAIDFKNDPVVNLNSLFTTQFEYFSENPYFVNAIFSENLIENNIKINDTVLNIMKVKQKYLSEIIKKGQDLGIFTKSISFEEIIHIIMGSVRLLMFKWKMSKFSFDIKSKGNELITSILTLIVIK